MSRNHRRLEGRHICMAQRGSWLGLLMVSSLAAGCGNNAAVSESSQPQSAATSSAVDSQGTPEPTNVATPPSTSTAAETEPSTTASTVDPCPETPPFIATFLPAGFSDPLLPGSGGQITIGPTGSITPIEPPDPNVYHYAGEPGVFVDFARGDTGHRPLTPEPVNVLDRPAEFGTIEDGFVVEFSVDDGPCGTYAMLAYGVAEADTKGVAAGLVLHA